MMLSSLLALVAAVTTINAEDLGTSPLVDEAHTHRWVEFVRDAKGIAWLDEAWRDQAEVDGVPLVLILFRAEIAETQPTITDFVLAVDCQRRMTGMTRIWLFKSEYGDGIGKEAPLELEAMGSEPDKEDLKTLDFACNTGSTLK